MAAPHEQPGWVAGAMSWLIPFGFFPALFPLAAAKLALSPLEPVKQEDWRDNVLKTIKKNRGNPCR